MGAAARSAATLAVLLAILAVWLVWGFTQATKPFPARDAGEAPVCTNTTIPAGERVRPDDVTVSVLNAGSRQGLAGRTMQLFVDAGFGQGDSGNAPEGTEVSTAQIWTDDPTSPAVRLVASRVAGAEIVEQASSSAGITVVVGDQLEELQAGRRGVRAREDTVVCAPAAPSEPVDPLDPAAPAG
jgi:hypothetical protein